MNQHGRHVDEFGRDVNIQFPQLFDVGQILCGDFRDRNIVDIDVLLANQIQQQVERTLVNAADADREGKVAFLLAALLRGCGHRSEAPAGAVSGTGLDVSDIGLSGERGS